MRLLIAVVLNLLSLICYGQESGRIALRGDFSQEDSIHIADAYMQGRQAVNRMYAAMKAIWDVAPQPGQSKKALRIERWQQDATFMKWLGEPDGMRLVRRNIRKIHHKFDQKFILEVVKADEGRCNRFVGAWAVPYGRMKIRLCRNFLNMRSDQGAKILIHEVGHEAGILFHQDLFSCRDVLQAAAGQSDQARRSPETYAWLAMSYEGLDCFSRWGY